MNLNDVPDSLKIAYKEKFIKDENWTGTNADGFDFFQDIEINFDPEYVSKALLEIKKKYPDLLDRTGATKKSNVKSAGVREMANQLFKEKKWWGALRSYSKSVALAENGSTELGFAYANRSALLLYRGFYKECLEDIDRALKLDYPSAKRPQLITRKDKARELIPTQKKSITQEVVPLLPSKNKNLRGASQSIAVAEDKTYGRFIQATRDIAPGEIMLIEEPYTLVLTQSFKTTHCGDCSILCLNLIPCKECSVEMYCSEKCRDKAFVDYHQYECIVSNFYPSEIFSVTDDTPVKEQYIFKVTKEQIQHLALRITLKGFRNYHHSATDDSDGDLYEKVGKLQTHRNDLSKSALMILSFNLAKQFEILKKHTNLLSELHFKDRQDILMYHLLRNRLICSFNQLTMHYKLDNVEYELMPALGLYTSYSMFNHACVENVGYGFYGSTVVVRALRTIKKGEQCFVNYGFYDKEQQGLERNSAIARNYLFVCKCIACENKCSTFDMASQSKANLRLESNNFTLSLWSLIEQHKVMDEEDRQALFQEYAKLERDGIDYNITIAMLFNLIMSVRYQVVDF